MNKIIIGSGKHGCMLCKVRLWRHLRPHQHYKNGCIDIIYDADYESLIKLKLFFNFRNIQYGRQMQYLKPKVEEKLKCHSNIATCMRYLPDFVLPLYSKIDGVIAILVSMSPGDSKTLTYDLWWWKQFLLEIVSRYLYPQLSHSVTCRYIGLRTPS